MSYKRQVTYAVAQSSTVDRLKKPLSTAAVQREYQLFGTFIQLLAKGDPHISSTFALATPAEAGLLVTLESALPEPEMDIWMAEMLSKLNASVEDVVLVVVSKTTS